VEITGEAYFEVAAKADMPFRVATPADGIIEVLGTSFDINAYSNEPVVATTLVNGAVRVRAGAKSSLLSPGQQARVKEGNDIQIVSNANIQQVVAWKEGIFDLQNRRLDEVMRQLARWYDIEVVYEKGIPSIEFYGEMGTNLNLSQVLKMLEGTGVKFRMEGTRKLVVMP
jgi:ferric-dicitrate binding protein FerR (iron transport regulator)